MARKIRDNKKCIKCGGVKPLSMFGSNPDQPDGRQSYCNECKNALGKRRREKNVTARLRHHISTRVADQLGGHCPENITRDLEKHLGYRIPTLVAALREDLRAREDKSLRQALNEGYHIDHTYPLSRYRVVVDGGVDWDEFQRCWAISNLRAISAEENLSKGARVTDTDTED